MVLVETRGSEFSVASAALRYDPLLNLKRHPGDRWDGQVSAAIRGSD